RETKENPHNRATHSTHSTADHELNKAKTNEYCDITVTGPTEEGVCGFRRWARIRRGADDGKEF
ncbi:MAG: hypothetical protein ACRC9V_08060, partial [Aeromonas sp.]